MSEGRIECRVSWHARDHIALALIMLMLVSVQSGLSGMDTGVFYLLLLHRESQLKCKHTVLSFSRWELRFSEWIRPVLQASTYPVGNGSLTPSPPAGVHMVQQPPPHTHTEIHIYTPSILQTRQHRSHGNKTVDCCLLLVLHCIRCVP